MWRLPTFLLVSGCCLSSVLAAQDGQVLRATKISGLTAPPGVLLQDGDLFGTAVTALGDLDGNGVTDFAVGAPGDDELGPDRGAVHVLLMSADRTVLASHKIVAPAGLVDGAGFGTALTSLGDLDGDGRRELVVGAPAATNPLVRGQVLLLRLDATGSVASSQVITEGSNGFSLSLSPTEPFGQAVGAIGDLDGNGTEDLAVGGGFEGSGASVFTLRLNAAGIVTNAWEIGNGLGGFSSLVAEDFGASIVGLGDLDGDGVPELAVGDNDQGFTGHGGYWTLFMEPRGTVRAEVFTRGSDRVYGPLFETRLSRQGDSVAALGDVDGDGLPDLVLGGSEENNSSCMCSPDPERVPEAGAIWVVQLRGDGTPRTTQKINVDEGGFTGFLEAGDHFGADVAGLGDFGGDGRPDVLVGAPGDDDGGPDRGAVYLLELLGLADPAAAAVRNGTHRNRVCLSSTSLPRLGALWSVEVDAGGHPGATFSLLLLHGATATPPVTVGSQELLLDGSSPRLLTSVRPSGGAKDSFSFPVPIDPALTGAEATAQAFVLGGFVEYCNALELRIGN